MAMDGGLEVLCGLSLDGARLTEVEDLAIGRGRIGCGVFGPTGLLRDLEMRLGLSVGHIDSSRPVRVARWSTRLAALAPRGRFFSPSYEVDAWGTASELLRMRDLLVEAGWDGAALDGAGPRLAQLSEVEAYGDTPLPPGPGDRMRAVVAALAAGARPGYVRVRLVEHVVLWSHRWQMIFARLAATGCHLELVEPTEPHAPAQSDLGRMQQHLLLGGDAVIPDGDGTLVFLRGETVWETAHATAGLLRAWQRPNEGPTTVVIRNGNALPLDLALEQAGLPTQGISSPSRLRPLLQVLPLALELAFEPKDPYRVLELLALPGGPFGGPVARHLAEALAKKPGLGSDDWQAAKVKAADVIRQGVLSDDTQVGKKPGAVDAAATRRIDKAMRRVAEWIEAPGYPQAAAPRAALLAVVERVQGWLQGRMMHARRAAARRERDEAEANARAEANPDADTNGDADPDADLDDHDDSLLAIAYAQAAALAETLTADPRDTLGLVQVRQLVAAVVGVGGTIRLHDEQAGRIDHVDHAAALLRPRGTVLWWNCTAAGAEAPHALPFSRVEQTALHAAGVHLRDARAEMAETAAAWRRAALAATERLVLVAPRVECGERVAEHPFWDELGARMGGQRHDLARVSLSAHDVLHGRSTMSSSWLVGVRTPVATEDIAATSLPSSKAEWRVDPRHLARGDRASATSLETLLGCPLRWTLEHRGGLRTGSMVSLPEDRRLNGTLGHRLVELLHRGGAFALAGDELRARALATLDDILPREGATLLLPGHRGELAQVRHQLATAVGHLGDLLHRSKLEIVDVEKEERVDWQGRTLVGHLDMLLATRDGKDVVLDLKWGRKTHTDKLVDGTAVQLAVYAYLRKQTSGKAGTGAGAAGGAPFPAVAYFSLLRGGCHATDDRTFEGAQVYPGIDAETTWRHTEVTLRLIERHLEKGRIPVTGIVGALPLVQECGGPVDPQGHLVLASDAACDYCEFHPICGRRWDAQR